MLRAPEKKDGRRLDFGIVKRPEFFFQPSKQLNHKSNKNNTPPKTDSKSEKNNLEQVEVLLTC